MSDNDTTPLQADMFSGNMKDTRSRTQRLRDAACSEDQQLTMFRQRDIAQFGVRSYRVMDVSPGPLRLIREDPRTDEEIEADLQREAEALTISMFGEEIKAVETEQTTTMATETDATSMPADPRHVFLRQDPLEAVAHASQEWELTEWIDPQHRDALAKQGPSTLLKAARAGHSPEKCQEAQLQGQTVAARIRAEKESETIEENAEYSDSQNVAHQSKPSARPKGFREQFRQEKVAVRRR